MLDDDLIHADVELFGQHCTGAGINGLAHFDIGHDQTDRSLGIDPDEGVGCERRIPVGGRRGGITLLAPRVDEGVRLAGSEPDKGQRQATGRECATALEIDGVLDRGAHAAPAASVCGPSGLPVAACLMAARMRT